MALAQRRSASRFCRHAIGVLAKGSNHHLTLLLLLLQVKVETKPWKIEVRSAVKQQPVQHFHIELPCRNICQLRGAPP